MTIRTLFDGQKIILPKELAGHIPCEVEITFMDVGESVPAESLWNIVARATGARSPQEILKETSEERDLWGRE